MNTKRHGTVRTGFLAAVAALALFAFVPLASATVVRINFSGIAGGGYADLTLVPAAPADMVNPAHPPSAISTASGNFNGVAITGVLGINHAPLPTGEVLPDSYSLFSIPGYGDHDGVSYDNLFYQNGSPLICYVNGDLVYPFAGGFLDLMGVMFTLNDGSFLDLWSFGETAPGFFGPSWPGGLSYGIKVIAPTAGGYEVLPLVPFVTASVPEPDFLWLFGAALVALFAWRRSVESRKV